jgi:SAM-dependent methyltransferase
MSERCRLCGQAAVERLIEFGSHPIAHQFLESPEQREYTHPLTLGFCGTCGLVQLVDPIPPERLYTQYNWLSSWKWNPHVPRLLEAIEQLPGVSHESPVFEVGSNDGTFLAELRSRGFSKLLGLEPARDAQAAAAARGIETIPAYFTPKVADEITASFGRCDVFLARQVLEHVSELGEFADAMRRVLNPGAHVLVEVPDFGFNQEAPDYSAIWEEHVNHFTERTLERFLNDAGVAVQHCETALFSGQVLIAIGRYIGEAKHEVAPAELEALRQGAYAYRDRWPRFRAAINDYLETQRSAGKRVAVYGAGCRSNTLINLCELATHLECVLDDQVEKQGKFMPGSRLRVLPGDSLAEDGIDLCLLAVNAENEETVIARRAEFIAGGGEFASIHPPSPRLPEFWRSV